MTKEGERKLKIERVWGVFTDLSSFSKSANSVILPSQICSKQCLMMQGCGQLPWKSGISKSKKTINMLIVWWQKKRDGKKEWEGTGKRIHEVGAWCCFWTWIWNSLICGNVKNSSNEQYKTESKKEQINASLSGRVNWRAWLSRVMANGLVNGATDSDLLFFAEHTQKSGYHWKSGLLKNTMNSPTSACLTFTKLVKHCKL